MKLRIPPPAITLISGALIWAIAYVSDFGNMEIPARRAIYYVFACLSLLIGFLAIFGFRSAKTSIDPAHPEKTRSLVTEGIYQFSRNPMYLGLLLLLIAWSVYVSNWMALPVLGLFVYYLTEFQIKPEEEVLQKKFGDAYADYTSKVRRWL